MTGSFNAVLIFHGGFAVDKNSAIGAGVTAWWSSWERRKVTL